MSMNSDGTCIASGHWGRAVELWDTRPAPLRAPAADVQMIDQLLVDLGSPATVADRIVAMTDIDASRRATLQRLLLYRASALNGKAFAHLKPLMKAGLSRARCIETLRADADLAGTEKSIAIELAEALVQP
jgi:hypothetical protein